MQLEEGDLLVIDICWWGKHKQDIYELVSYIAKSDEEEGLLVADLIRLYVYVTSRRPDQGKVRSKFRYIYSNRVQERADVPDRPL